jgi:release factor glutamine methyltransferase
VTVLEIIKRSTEFLSRQGVDSPRLQSELLLAHVLGIPRLKLYLDFERKLLESEIGGARELVKRRGGGEPLQHILGTACFCGFEIKVNRQVLIPRPETELLAEKAWTFLGTSPEAKCVLDYGTGSGCLAIAIAAKCPQASIIAADISPEALQVAEQNAVVNKVTERIRFVRVDSLAGLPKEPFDLIVSNPPYIPTDEIPKLQREVRDFDPTLALDGGPDGLSFYRTFAASAAPWLKPGGAMMLEFGDGQGADLQELFAKAGWSVQQIVPDYAGKARHIILGR